MKRKFKSTLKIKPLYTNKTFRRFMKTLNWIYAFDLDYKFGMSNSIWKEEIRRFKIEEGPSLYFKISEIVNHEEKI